MAIYVEPNELSSTSRLPNIPLARPLAGLEADTGADMMITPLSIPCNTPKLMALHMNQGAMLIQRKSGSDLVSSFGDRLLDSISRMNEVAPLPCQRVLLFTGVISQNRKTGQALIDGRPCRNNGKEVEYGTILRAMRRWTLRGGTVEQIIRDSYIPQWCVEVEEDLALCRENPEKWLFIKPDKLDREKVPGLQKPRRIRDARMFLSGFRGMGTVRVNEIWDACGGRLDYALHALTDRNPETRPACIPQWLVDSIRQQAQVPNEVDFIGPEYIPF